jgi:hypothetical protein
VSVQLNDFDLAIVLSAYLNIKHTNFQTVKLFHVNVFVCYNNNSTDTEVKLDNIVYNKQNSRFLITAAHVAQWIRHRPPKPRIVGSSPTVGKLFSLKCERKQRNFVMLI